MKSYNASHWWILKYICSKVTGGSANMEPFACKTLLVSLVNDFGLKISSFTTDRSSSISVKNKMNFRQTEH